MSALPYPTPTRLRLADAIVAGHIRHYHWVNPQSIDTVRDVHVTARLAELVAAGLAAFGEREDSVLSWSTAVLTPDGMAWVTRARTREPLRLGDAFPELRGGPGSTSPEPGPPPLAEAPTLTQIVEFLDPDGTLRSESTKDGTK